ncbi:TRAF3-interacting JNK-activating modulator [Austrofundulus limnaeus]|uniref:TRAF3-interacting JNK-activating modulator n=1 Tax=Austrofundulus limnaeus TaxID=52670 RepID=A0A2I4C6S0_AUSLI|nr:PREDICTED: TRAF3-interacting JNK-activating modulator-like [Austrofundulus limnaeus]
MDSLSIVATKYFPEREFDQKANYRAEKREHLRGRNNVTSCRSPTRDDDTRQIKNELKEKRHLEFLRRRSVSPEPSGSKCKNCSKRRNPALERFPKKYLSKSESLYTNTQHAPSADEHQGMILTTESRITQYPGTSKWALLWSEPITPMNQEKRHARKQTSTSTTVTVESSQHWTTSMQKRGTTQKTSITTVTQAERVHQKSLTQTENARQNKTLREIGVQTKSGLVTVKESDIQKLSDCVQEALWREEAVKKKLALLKELAANFMSSSDVLWTSRCNEDLLRNKIKVLEAQLQVCVQTFPKDGVKKLVLQMEKQREMYEEKALVLLQKASQEKSEAISRAETLQEALKTAQTEAERWESLYTELKLSSGQLRENQHLCDEQLQWLHSQLELFKTREHELRDEVTTLRQEKQELQYNVCLLEEDNQTLREELQQLQDGGDEAQDFFVLERLKSEDDNPRLTARRDSQLEEELRHTQERLQLKEKECEELQTELHTMEQECQSSQARLSQCRDELRQLSHRRRRTAPCGSWWRLCMILLLLLAVAGLVMLWSWHPPFRDQVDILYSDIQTRIEDYLMEMASPRHSGCFRPI